MKTKNSKSAVLPILAVLVFMSVSYGETLMEMVPGVTVIDLVGFYIGAFATGMFAGVHLSQRRRSADGGRDEGHRLNDFSGGR